ncbi:MAG TPA: aminotransferase class I/II-fold pyridoxal phosphate-dependent enzyme [Chthoniobacterales bacterium]|nr:aminotransferase class I/II-fold pyridoxal phosphate-dependent enzyme [Chthoniobacterales bacterium]
MKNPSALSRRGFTKLLGAGAAFAALRPALSLSESTPKPTEPKPSDVVRLSSNENPYGPSPIALKAMTAAFPLAWKYPDDAHEELVEALAKLNQVPKEQILCGAGSGEILKVAVAAFTGPNKKLVVGDPTFEAAAGHTKASGAEVVKVKLNPAFHHDLPKMLEAAGAGLQYICNPNNPTASITPKAHLREFIAKVPRETIVLVDEAYHHFVESADYESVISMVKDHPNLVVARTFSKIYGMAGLRCGYCIAQPDKIELMRTQQSWDSVSLMAIVAARASLDDNAQVENGRKNNSEVRKLVCGELDKLKFSYIPSEANFIMIDLRREVKPVIAAFREKKVQVGRLFPPLPNHLRVTIGTRLQMERFLAVFKELTA